MSETIVVLINGEVLANGHGSSIPDQKENSRKIAEGLKPILTGKMKVAVLYDNKPQVGFVLLRAEIASYSLHSIPLDICGADTQGATGYMLNLAFHNVLFAHGNKRNVVSVITHTLVDDRSQGDQPPIAIGPWYNRERAEQFRATRKWEIMEDPGRGYRRVVSSLAPIDIMEMDSIQQLVDSGEIVIAAGGGGIPVALSDKSELVGVEAVVATERVACMFAQRLNAKTLLIVVEKAKKYILAGLKIDKMTHFTLERLDNILEQEKIQSRTVRSHLHAASEFLHGVGEQVIVTTVDNLCNTLEKRTGLLIGSLDMSIK